MRKLKCSVQDYYIDGADEFTFNKLREFILKGDQFGVQVMMGRFNLQKTDDVLKLFLMSAELRNEMRKMLKTLSENVETLLLDAVVWPIIYCEIANIVKKYWPGVRFSTYANKLK